MLTSPLLVVRLVEAIHKKPSLLDLHYIFGNVFFYSWGLAHEIRLTLDFEYKWPAPINDLYLSNNFIVQSNYEPIRYDVKENKDFDFSSALKLKLLNISTESSKSPSAEHFYTF